MHSIIFSVFLTLLPIVPCPQKVEELQGVFDSSDARVIVKANIPDYSKDIISEFAVSYGFNESSANRRIVFKCKKSLSDEAYRLTIKKKSIKVESSSHRGFVYAVQTLKQLLTEYDQIPCVKIEDAPLFHYRGSLLDCARKYYDVEFIKKYLDIMAFHKLNTFHWHLTDDHGWRLEIKKYPKLTEVGAFGDIGSRADYDPLAPGQVQYEGFYSREDVSEVVAYAARLGIDVIPEIDLPGHMTAAMAAYPWLGCTGGPYQVINVVGPRGKGLARDSLCPGKESTISFIEDVLSEVIELFPGKYIHLGGDECIKDRWMSCPHCNALADSLGLEDNELGTKWQQLEVWMINELSNFLDMHGKTAIGWDEILDGSLGRNAVVMSWRGVETGKRAAERGYDVIMCPVKYCYFDYRQSRAISKEPKALAGTVMIDSVYAYKPLDNLSEEEASHVLGVQANMWCDVVGSEDYVEYMLLPRLAALSEVQWCDPNSKDWNRFKDSVTSLRKYYDANGYVYAKHIWGVVGLPGYETELN